jgi:hypothetical protein
MPIEKALSYDIFKALVLNFAEDTIDVDEKVRKELGMVENLGFQPVPEEQTEEEAAALLEELNLKKADAAKKTKQKPKTEEEEAADLEQLVQKSSQELAQTLTQGGERLQATEKEIELVKTRWLMQNHIQMDAGQYDCINRKLSIYDIELGSKDIVLRLDLDIALSKFVPPVKINEILSAGKSLDHPGSVGRDSKLRDRRSELDSVVSASPLGQEEEFWK